MFNFLFILLVALAVVEFSTTAYGLFSKKAKELNPLLAWMIRKLSLVGMMSVKLIGTAFIFWVILLLQKEWLVLIMMIPLFYACWFNLRTTVGILK